MTLFDYTLTDIINAAPSDDIRYVSKLIKGIPFFTEQGRTQMTARVHSELLKVKYKLPVGSYYGDNFRSPSRRYPRRMVKRAVRFAKNGRRRSYRRRVARPYRRTYRRKAYAPRRRTYRRRSSRYSRFSRYR